MALPLIESCEAQGLRPRFIFVTDAGGSFRRAQESIACLRYWGVGEDQIEFLGAEKGFVDGTLHTQASRVHKALAAFECPELKRVALYVIQDFRIG